MDHVVVDVEIMKTIEETPGGWDATDQLGVAVACVWQYADQRMRIYGPEDMEMLRRRLLTADRISGFNIFNFDFPVIWGIGKPEWKDRIDCGGVKLKLTPKTDDLLRRIWQAKGLDPDTFTDAHKGYILNAVASKTIGASKVGYGGDAPKWYQGGLVQKVCNYCADDVAIERDLTDFVDRYGYIIDPTTDKRLSISPWGS